MSMANKRGWSLWTMEGSWEDVARSGLRHFRLRITAGDWFSESGNRIFTKSIWRAKYFIPEKVNRSGTRASFASGERGSAKRGKTRSKQGSKAEQTYLQQKKQKKKKERERRKRKRKKRRWWWWWWWRKVEQRLESFWYFAHARSHASTHALAHATRTFHKSHDLLYDEIALIRQRVVRFDHVSTQCLYSKP